MANKKRKERMSKLYRVKLGRYRLTRRDILVLEKLVRIYADSHEKRQAAQFGHSTIPPDGRRYMPRKYADMHVTLNGLQADSVKFLPRHIKRSHRFKIRCRPGLWIEFTPLNTTIGAQVLYATGPELNVINEVVAKIRAYLEKCDRSIINLVDLSK
ncbi:hypothetical protein GX865_04325 [Candidatus Saccharibacteria bacterium]|jgi:hypothetical protein|nr:hypothetical protein [Candidatus Saccharibacteria bacterium]